MRNICCCILLALFCNTTNGQLQQQADSLRILLTVEKTDTGKVRRLIQMGRLFESGREQIDSVFFYLQQALDLAKKIKAPAMETQATFYIATNMVNSGNYTGALILSLQNLKRLEQIKAEQHISVNLNVGDLYFYQTRLLVFIYSYLGDYAKQLEYVKKMQAIYHAKLEQEPNVSDNYNLTIYFNLANAYNKLNQPDSVFHYSTLLYSRVQQKNDPQWLALAGNLLATYHEVHGSKDSAMAFSRSTIAPATASGRLDVVTSCELRIGKLLLGQGRLDSAFHYSLKALRTRLTLNKARDLVDAYKQVSELYEHNKQYDSAFKYLQKKMLLEDSLQDLSKIAEAQNFVFNQTLSDQQLAQARKEASLQLKNKIRMYALAAIIAFVLMATVLLLRNLRNKRNANILLTRQKEEIEKNLSALKATQAQLIQSEKMASLGELTAGIAHEIQNPLNFVNNFSEINMELIDELKSQKSKLKKEEEEELLSDIFTNNEKINHHGKRADAIVKGMLQHSRKSEAQKEPTDINALCDEYLRLSYHGLRAKDKSFNATLQTDFDESIGKINIIPQDIGRVIMNLLTNAFYTVAEKKKACQTEYVEVGGNYEPTVSISTKKIHDSIEIRVEDNGNGIPPNIINKIFQPFFTTKPTGQGTGLGLSLSYDIVKAHGGTLEVATELNSGTKFIMQLPVN